MRRIVLSIIFFVLCILAVSCSEEKKLPMRKVTEYTEKMVETKLPLQLKLDCENCKLEIYRWKKQMVKFEYTTSVTGEYSEERLAEQLESFTIKTMASDSDVTFKSSYNGGMRTNGSLELRVYIPKRTERIELVCKKGNLKLFDDMEGELLIRGEKLDVDINRLDGRLECSIEEGDVRLTAGKLSDGSMIKTVRGNICIKAEYDPAGIYHFIAKEGLLDVFLPKNLNVIFNHDFPSEYVDAEYSYEEYLRTELKEDVLNQEAACFELESGINRIHITRF